MIKGTIVIIIAETPKECKTWENRICLCTKEITMPCGLYSDKKKSGRVRKKILLINRRWKKNSSDRKLWLSLPASWGP